MAKTAILVCNKLEGPTLRLSRILDLLEVPWRTVDPDSTSSPPFPDRDYSVLIEVAILGSVLVRSRGVRPSLLQQAESAFVYAPSPSAATATTLSLLTGCTLAELVRLQGSSCSCTVSSDGMCGPMGGLKVDIPLRHPEFALKPSSQLRIDPLISAPEGCFFGAVSLDIRRWYVSLGSEVIDIDRPVEKGFFDVTDFFLAAAPAVMYLRHAFAEILPLPPEHGACLIIDDPVLRSRYGFVDF